MSSSLLVHSILRLAVALLLWQSVRAAAENSSGGFRPLRIWDREILGREARAWAVTQDAAGRILVGADSLLTFDGDRWEKRPLNDSYAIRALAAEDNGRIWVGGVNELGYFTPAPDGSLRYTTLRPSLPPSLPAPLGDIWSVFTIQGGAVFFTESHVLRYRHQQWDVWPFPGSRRLHGMRVGDAVWFCHAPTGLWSIEEAGPTLQIPAQELASNVSITYVLASRSQGLLFVSNQGIFQRQDHQLTPWSASGSEFVKNRGLVCATVLPDDRIAVGSLSGGLGLISPDGSSLEIVDRNSGLPSDAVLSLYADKNGLLWIGLFAHLAAMATRDDIRLITPALGLPEASVNALAEYAGTMQVATDNGTYAWTEGRFAPNPSLPGRHTDLLPTPHGLLASRHRGVELLTDGQARLIYETLHDVPRLGTTHSSDTWLLGEGFSVVALTRAADGGWSSRKIAALPDSANSFAWASPHQVWVGTHTRGLQLLEESLAGGWSVSLVTQPTEGFDERTPVSVAKVGSHIVAFNPQGGFQLNPITRKLTALPHLPSLAHLAHATDPRSGRLWVALSAPFQDDSPAFAVGDLSERPDGTLAWNTYPMAATASIGNVDDMACDSRGDVWISGDKAILKLSPSATAIPSSLGKPAITVTGEQRSFAYNSKPIDFHVGTFEFAHRGQLRVQTRLRGLTDEWSQPNNKTSFTFSGLREGSYEFEARVLDAANHVGPTSSWQFSVSPPWYRSQWSYVLIVAALITITLTISWLRQRRLVAQSQELERAVQRKTSELAKANAAKTEFIANMSHEIRHPIAGILGLAVALEDSSLAPEQRRWVQSIKSCGYLLDHLVSDVLDFAKIEAGRATVDYTTLRPSDLIANCAAILARPAQDAGCALRTVVDAAAEKTYRSDPGRIQQILLNFLTNAFKFAPGTTVELGCYREADGALDFYVRDQGAGIAAEDMEKLFSKFTRLKSARDAQVRGSGLGLALCRVLARQLGGDVEAESTLGQGSCFHLRLPLSEVQAAPVRELTRPGHCLRALVVDDIDYAAAAAAAVLRRLGFDTVVAHDGPSAVERWSQDLFDVVLLDLDLTPAMSGEDVVRALRAREKPFRRAAILAASAHTSSDRLEPCLAQGFDGYITKPVTPEKLATALSRLVKPLRPAISVQAPIPVAPLRDGRTDSPAAKSFERNDFPPENTALNAEGIRAEVTQLLDAAESAIEQGQPDAIRRTAHRIVNYAQLIDEEAFALCARRLESYAEVTDPVIQQRLVGELRQAWLEVSRRSPGGSPSAAPV